MEGKDLAKEISRVINTNEKSCESCNIMWKAFKEKNPNYIDDNIVQFPFI